MATSDRYGDSLNPFSDGGKKKKGGADDYNPFDVSQNVQYTSESEDESTSNKKASKPLIGTGATGDRDKVLSAREAELARREKEITHREQELQRKLKEYEGQGFHPKNWPSCYPIAYHDIDAEIPDTYKVTVKHLFAILIGTWCCFAVNWLAVVVCWISLGLVNAGSFILATLYACLGIPAAWQWWYRGYYYGARDGSTRRFIYFFVGFGAHLFFACVMAIGVPGTAGAGVFMVIDAFKNTFAGFLVLACAMMWGVNALVTFYMYGKAHSVYCAMGGNARRDISSIAVQSAVGTV